MGAPSVVVPDDDAAWVEAVKALLDDPARRAALRDAGLRQHRETVPTWADVLAEDLLTVWRRAASSAEPDPAAAVRVRI